MKSKKGTVLIVLGAALILAALLLTAYNFYDEKRAEKNASDMLDKINAISSEENDGAVADYILNPDMAMPTVVIDGEEYVGVLSIPEIGIELPIMNECDSQKLKISPCRYSGTAYLGNMIIAGHNYRTHMRYINTLKAGDKIIFTDMDKNVFEYEVVATEIIDGYDVEGMLAEGAWDLTVFTCTYGGRKRMTVRAISA